MDKSTTLTALQALAQDTRLDVFRLLVQANSSGLAAGEIATLLDVRQNTLSTHLAILTQAGLLTANRDGRSIRYAVNSAGLQSILGYLLEDCCGGKPELCQPLIKSLSSNPDPIFSARKRS